MRSDHTFIVATWSKHEEENGYYVDESMEQSSVTVQWGPMTEEIADRIIAERKKMIANIMISILRNG